MNIDHFIVYIKNDIYKDIAEDVKTRFDTSNYKLEVYWGTKRVMFLLCAECSLMSYVLYVIYSCFVVKR